MAKGGSLLSYFPLLWWVQPCPEGATKLRQTWKMLHTQRCLKEILHQIFIDPAELATINAFHVPACMIESSHIKTFQCHGGGRNFHKRILKKNWF